MGRWRDKTQSLFLVSDGAQCTVDVSAFCERAGDRVFPVKEDAVDLAWRRPKTEYMAVT